MWELLESSAKRGMLHRIHFFGLPVRDIQEALPHQLFDLKQDWTELRQQHEAAMRIDPKVQRNFKEWLKQTGRAHINVKTMGEAFDALDAIPGPLADLLAKIESTASAALLDR